MPETTPLPLPELFSEDAVFTALVNPGRRHLLRRMVAAGGSLTAGECGDGHRKQRNLMVKHLAVLLEGGIVRAATDERDARKMRYSLSAGILSQRTETGWELDFGCTVLRWKAGAESSPFPRPAVRQRRR